MENHIADNHVWQMTLRILTMAAFSVYGDLPEANTWVDYCYNVWLARFPGLNKDGGWHNGDSYFTVNTRTLVEVPYYYSKLTGYDFFPILGIREISCIPSSSNLLFQIRRKRKFSSECGTSKQYPYRIFGCAGTPYRKHLCR